MKKFLATISVLTAILGVTAFASPVLAATDPCVDNPNASVCQDLNDTSGSKFSTTIQNIINVLLMGVGIVAVIMIIIGAIRFTTSNGDPGRAKAARTTITYAVIGLVVALLAFAIVNYVIGNL